MNTHSCVKSRQPKWNKENKAIIKNVEISANISLDFEIFFLACEKLCINNLFLLYLFSRKLVFMVVINNMFLLCYCIFYNIHFSYLNNYKNLHIILKTFVLKCIIYLHFLKSLLCIDSMEYISPCIEAHFWGYQRQ